MATILVHVAFILKKWNKGFDNFRQIKSAEICLEMMGNINIAVLIV